MNRFNEALDRYITGNYGEDQFKEQYTCATCNKLYNNEKLAEDCYDKHEVN
jgi:hypothetical protein